MYTQVSLSSMPTNSYKKSESENKWMTRLDRVIEPNPGDPGLSNMKLAEKLSISERDLFRKVKKMTGLSPQKYLRRYRLRQARKYLINGKHRTVNQTANAVGYSNVSYFIKLFELEFGIKPLQVLQENGWR